MPQARAMHRTPGERVRGAAAEAPSASKSRADVEASLCSPRPSLSSPSPCQPGGRVTASEPRRTTRAPGYGALGQSQAPRDREPPALPRRRARANARGCAQEATCDRRPVSGHAPEWQPAAGIELRRGAPPNRGAMGRSASGEYRRRGTRARRVCDREVRLVARGCRAASNRGPEARRLAPLRSSAPDGYGDFGFASSSLAFPCSGCWEVTGRVGDSSLTFVTLVIGA